MAEPLLIAQKLTKIFGALKATDELSLEVQSGEIHAMIGPNGAGKTTAIGQLSGELKSNAGTIFLPVAILPGSPCTIELTWVWRGRFR